LVIVIEQCFKVTTILQNIIDNIIEGYLGKWKV
jgi:hypothetical protein